MFFHISILNLVSISRKANDDDKVDKKRKCSKDFSFFIILICFVCTFTTFLVFTYVRQNQLFNQSIREATTKNSSPVHNVKGQLISKANSAVFIWTKKQMKTFFYFCPEDILLRGFEPHSRKIWLRVQEERFMPK